ncbi:MAG: hypothetical protein QOG79_6855 [Mycobacterium sp.]|jgi:hypothetical protein|nr:hypothetical protein [Mycobacterium sp.]MDT5303533.1 hypothetical protein [Mycobacterium sp.]MDT5319723.1 hypothetical protein [Mycobacterium sp.]
MPPLINWLVAQQRAPRPPELAPLLLKAADR